MAHSSTQEATRARNELPGWPVWPRVEVPPEDREPEQDSQERRLRSSSTENLRWPSDSRQEPDSTKPVDASEATVLSGDGLLKAHCGNHRGENIRMVLKAASEHELHLFKPGSSETPRSGHLWPGSRKVDGLPATATLTAEEMPATTNNQQPTRTKRARWEALLVRRWMPVPMSPQGGNTMAENNTPSKKTFAERAAAEPTDLHKQFADWLKEKTGVDVDLKTVQLVTTMRMDFQSSEENQAALKERKAAAAKKAEEAKARKLAKLEAELAKLKGEEAKDEAKPEEPAEAPKADAEPTGEAEGENAPEAATEAAPEAQAEDKPKPRARRTRRTTGTK